MNTRIKRIMCIYPPTGVFNREDRCQDRAGDIITVVNRPPMPLLYEAAIAKKAGKLVFIRDYSQFEGRWDLLRKDVIQFKPDMVVFNVTTPSFKDDVKTCEIVKGVDRKITVVGSGAYFNIYDQYALRDYPGLDIVVKGEGEEVFRELIQGKELSEIMGISYKLNGKCFLNPNRPILDNLDTLPFPDRSQFNNRLSFRPDTREPEATIIVSRGCPFSCIFCLASSVHGSRVRIRSPKNIVDEMQQCKKVFGIKTFLFRSDLFTYDSRWVNDLCDEIISRNLKVGWACNTRVDTIDYDKAKMMKKAGCWAIAIGVESGNEESLKKMKKGITLKQSEEAVKICKRNGIQTFTYFLIGFPWEARKHIEDTIRFAIKLNADLSQFSPIYPYPGTTLYDMAKSLGLFKDEDLHPFALVRPVMGTLFLTKQEIENYLSVAWKRFHLRPSYIVKTLWQARSPQKIFNYLRFGCHALIKLNKLASRKSGRELAQV